MKKIFTFIMLLSFGSASFISCSTSKNSNKGILGGTNVGGTVVKTVATVVGLILLSKLLKSVLNTVGGSKSFAGLAQNQAFVTNFNEDTKLSSFAQSNFMNTALQVLVAEHYKIPISTVTNNFKSLRTAGDLATFIGKNAEAKVLAGIK